MDKNRNEAAPRRLAWGELLEKRAERQLLVGDARMVRGQQFIYAAFVSRPWGSITNFFGTPESNSA